MIQISEKRVDLAFSKKADGVALYNRKQSKQKLEEELFKDDDFEETDEKRLCFSKVLCFDHTRFIMKNLLKILSTTPLPYSTTRRAIKKMKPVKQKKLRSKSET